ncbi:sigma-54 dependent transcriptional regulator, gfr operon transcriptional activator [Enterococcus sp. DIV2402]|uniref:Sigma-54 dependent transcriptional regulator, gfr operon transcriptional activator n=1 Tax=Candidatus Enterococcus lowellii TaxID=2230877 RepID=A0ABZ2SNJ9_9ENTE|nr:sigma 54-interacting transcriptional regulator [Enterococcus sp. DIV2402]MBO0464082.1 sigma 54-interacting transcriptional regulator [Enterococcus sp. DIV2402]
MSHLEDKILFFAKDKCEEITIEDLEPAFFTTTDLEKNFAISRTQASRAANKLVSQQLLFKINTRPVLFSFVGIFEEKYMISVKPEYESLFQLQQEILELPSETIFEKMIGYDGSLSEAIEQLKTAVYYPENGLPIMLMGETGVGKSYFVQIMYEYIVKSSLLNENAPFITLNCAQYYNNPELLSGLLFGYAKGAFTGAYENRKGLLEEADKGLLFLDEVHRLNAEGQEKLFTFMDKGTFSRIGETKNRSAKVRLVFATTEKTDVFLQTFLRRIPIQIYIPTINERSILEKRQIIEYLFKKESGMIQKSIEITPRVMNILLQTIYTGNIGELENTIKYACGSAISQSSSEETIQIKIRDIPQKIYAAIEEQHLLVNVEGENLFFSKEGKVTETSNAVKELQKFIQHLNIILDQFQQQTHYEIKQQLYQQAVKFMDELIFQEMQTNQVALEKFILSTMQDIFREIEHQTKFQYDGNVVLFLSHYIYSYVLKGVNIVKAIDPELLLFVQRNYKLEMNALIKLLPEIEKRLDIVFTKADRVLFALFFATLKNTSKGMELDAIILAHGYATASSIANVCNRMLGEVTFAGIDMPIEATIHDISEKVESYIESNQVDQGLILMIDMGSLNMIYEELKQSVTVPILFIDQLSTPMALEVGNLMQQGKSLVEIAESMQEVIMPNVHIFQPEQSKRKAVITTCFSGLGIAIQIQKLLYDCLEGILDIDIIPIEFNELRAKGITDALKTKYDVLSIIGTNNLQLPKVKFLYLEEIISGDGKLNRLFENMLSEQEIREVNNRLVKNFSLIRVIDSLTILDTKKIMELVETCIHALEERLDLTLSNARKVAMFVHVSCMVERLIRHSEITEFPELEQFSFEHQKEIRVIQDVFSVLEPVYSVTVPLEEICYIHNILYFD